jgi:predicted nucleic acid-binding protein
LKAPNRKQSKVEKILGAIMKGQGEGIVSTVTIAEVLTGFYLTGHAARAAKAKRLLNDWTINGFKIVPVTFEIADLAANLRKRRKTTRLLIVPHNQPRGK